MFLETVAATVVLDQSLRPNVMETPLQRRAAFDRPGIQVYAKLENAQHTGSFKLRGATAKLQSLTAAELRVGVVTASTGNHGAAVARAAASLDTAVEVFVSADADERKVAAIRDLGADITALPGDPVAAEVAGRRAAGDSGRVFVSPYNDPTVVAGQGTVATELLRQLDRADAVIVSVGGGGLISGVAATMKTHSSARIIAASAANTAAMHHSVAAGCIIEVDHQLTLSDGTAGGIEAGAITFDMCRSLVDDWVLINEEEIAAAMRLYMRTYADRIEGSAAVALAAVGHTDVAGKVVVIICGGNVAPATLGKVGLVVD
ncbi:MAG: pyridoxal-phosphate dependent enzyme [bacterium]|nr:pyridoxal-phosphate dependent enzyme [bacterium]